jgi:pSer/pThr/pTyr-binding forkhead associated (FHA) protein
MQVRLIVKTARSRRVLTINRAVAIVGRAKGCSVRIPENDVSRRHCRIRQKDGFVVIEDLRSLNGTYVNGERITGARALRPGDAVEVGPMRFIVGYELSPAARIKLEGFETDVELLPEDSGPDFLEDVDGIEWIEEENVELQDELLPAAENVVPLEDDHPTSYKGQEEANAKEPVAPFDDSWVMPTDLQLTDLLEPIEDVEPKASGAARKPPQ